MALPDKNALIGPTVTEAQFKTNLGVIIDFVKPIELQSPSYSSTALLTATRPAGNQSYAKALDTGKVWFWDKPAGSADGNYWKVTDLSDLDQAKIFANSNPNFKAGSFSIAFDFDLQLTMGQYDVSILF
ncbi:hypothetical protein [Acinetobacter pittii]|uniref:hypothetical protein n=1 Tax=Acinetobacter pittii TaxID=48296 RepID=UPI001F197A8B|nr:hypothetical protein [Acinetobacter pittii]